MKRFHFSKSFLVSDKTYREGRYAESLWVSCDSLRAFLLQQAHCSSALIQHSVNESGYETGSMVVSYSKDFKVPPFTETTGSNVTMKNKKALHERFSFLNISQSFMSNLRGEMTCFCSWVDGVILRVSRVACVYFAFPLMFRINLRILPLSF